MKKASFFMLLAFIFLAGCHTSSSSPEKISFAQCITDAGYSMYGANRCAHCQSQKESFGIAAFDSINYIECTQEKLQCEIAGVTAYPTWIGPNYKQSGVHTLEQLAEITGCSLTQDTTETNENQGEDYQNS